MIERKMDRIKVTLAILVGCFFGGCARTDSTVTESAPVVQGVGYNVQALEYIEGVLTDEIVKHPLMQGSRDKAFRDIRSGAVDASVVVPFLRGYAGKIKEPASYQKALGNLTKN